MSFSDAFRKLLPANPPADQPTAKPARAKRAAPKPAAPKPAPAPQARGSFASLAARLGIAATPEISNGAHASPKASFSALAAKLMSSPARSSSSATFAGLASRLLGPSEEGFIYLPVVNGYCAWPDVGTRVLWSEETQERHGKVLRHGTARFSGRVTRVLVDEADPGDVDVWAAPDGGGHERRVGIAGIRVPVEDVPRFRARAEQVTAAAIERRARRLATRASYVEATAPSVRQPSKPEGSQGAPVSPPAAAAIPSPSAPAVRTAHGSTSAPSARSSTAAPVPSAQTPPPRSFAAVAASVLPPPASPLRPAAPSKHAPSVSHFQFVRLTRAPAASTRPQQTPLEPVAAAEPVVPVHEARRPLDAAAEPAPPVVDIVQEARRALEPDAGPEQPGPLDEPHTEARRREANLAAMQLAAELSRAPRPLTDDDRRILGAYSGWGGLSIQKAAGRIPPGFPAPEERGLIHEYYTPARVCEEVARVVAPLLPGLAGPDGVVHALEPSAGIGRFVRAFEGPDFESVEWHAVEWSALSAAMLRALRPKLDLFEGPFERWVTEHGPEFNGRLNLIVSNPPYGQRSHALTEDPVRSYRENNAYAYFLRRGLDLLARNGLGVYLIPSGFLSGNAESHRERRQKVLRRHHVSCAFRLPSGLFPGAHLVTDLLFFRARGLTLPEVDEADRFILDGTYFNEYPSHILGKVVGTAGNDDDQTKPPKRRWARAGGAEYEVVGEFTTLPEIRERPMCAACQHAPEPEPAAPRPSPRPARSLVQELREADARLASASSLGGRVAAFLTAVAAQENEVPHLAWEELHQGLVDWAAAHGAPSLDLDLLKLAKEDTGAQRFLAAFEPRSTSLIPALAMRPIWSPRYQGDPGDVLARAEFLYRQRRALSYADLGALDPAPLFAAGWCEDRPGELVPPDVYYSGELWPKVDRARAREAGDLQASAQLNKLLSLIRPAVFDEIQGLSPRQGWVPLQLVSEWLKPLNYGEPVPLVREGGLVQIEGTDYDELENKKPGYGASPDVVQIVGWINHDRTLFSPSAGENETVDDARLRVAAEWDQSFAAWCSVDEGRRTQIEQAYQRHFQGFHAPAYSAEPLKLTRWNPKRVPHSWQNAGARRVLANRGGLVAFDVGLGKTDCGLLCIAAARQEGWAKRPVILVPKSIVWKWVKDINRALPDYRVGVVGSKRKRIKHGPRAGQLISDTDTPAERAATWTRFMGGEFDVVVLTYQALARTKMNEDSILAYADATAAIQREVKLRQRNASKKEGRKNAKLSERETAILNEGTAAWVAEMLEIPEGWAYDPGILWDDIGADLLVIDEAQNFKNLHLPEPREHGVPRFMGNAGAGSHRAWQVEFRCAAVRRKTGGAGVVLLSATPAKNSPLEFYSLLGYVDGNAFTQQGIYDPEAYVDRYCRIEPREVVGTDMDVHTRSACVGFKNLDELRSTIFRYGEFRTAEQVGLPIPTPEVRRVEVDMDERQEAKYAYLVTAIEKALSNPESGDAILGFLARMALVAIHADLDAKYTWQTAKNVPSPHSPKFDALAREILKQQGCGHIVFCDNIAAHAWIRMVLEEAGIPGERIAVLNAEVAEGDVERLRIAMDFNGDPEEGTPPKYDVVIANAIAYEGIDLQTRTCAIHHIDLPWEPATLEQRNGRGRRQGNIHANIAIVYYFARRSSDGMRFDLIQGKRGWMTDILESQKKDTNNPGAQDKLGPEEVLLLISRDPAKTRARLDAVKEQRAAEARKKIAEEASAALRGAVARFASAQRARDPKDALRLRTEANLRLEDLARVDTSAWPWAGWAMAAREHAMLVPPGGTAPVYEGLRVATPSTYDPSVTDYAEFGRPFEGKTIGVRAAGAVAWKALSVEAVQNLRLRPEHATTFWPDDDDEKMARQMGAMLPRFSGYAARDAWKDLGWTHASDAFVERAWPRFGTDIIHAMRRAGWSAAELKIPVVNGGVMSIGIAGAFDAVLPPTNAGWEEFLRLGPGSRAKWGELEEAGVFWWGRKIPRDLLSSAREAQSPTPSARAREEGADNDEDS